MGNFMSIKKLVTIKIIFWILLLSAPGCPRLLQLSLLQFFPSVAYTLKRFYNGWFFQLIWWMWNLFIFIKVCFKKKFPVCSKKNNSHLVVNAELLNYTGFLNYTACKKATTREFSTMRLFWNILRMAGSSFSKKVLGCGSTTLQRKYSISTLFPGDFIKQDTQTPLLFLPLW